MVRGTQVRRVLQQVVRVPKEPFFAERAQPFDDRLTVRRRLLGREPRKDVPQLVEPHPPGVALHQFCSGERTHAASAGEVVSRR